MPKDSLRLVCGYSLSLPRKLSQMIEMKVCFCSRVTANASLNWTQLMSGKQVCCIYTKIYRLYTKKTFYGHFSMWSKHVCLDIAYFGLHLWTVFYPQPRFNDSYYKDAPVGLFHAGLKFSTHYFVMLPTFPWKQASTFHTNRQSLFSWKKYTCKNNFIILSSSVFTQRVMKITFGFDIMSFNI